MPEYQFLTNHAQVLLCVAHETEQRRIGDLLEVLLGENGPDPAPWQRQRTS